ncbi:CTP synthase 1-B isoform X1 [Xenopus laevis]|uniref:CTP synthase 1-B isoform X1 n=1 Tax=Xenopus laevis TaxID=8355 RepID=A0A8J1M537_XENLA|nr:CTP synthase 1-B isoform X1 [Xenopus laevis]
MKLGRSFAVQRRSSDGLGIAGTNCEYFYLSPIVGTKSTGPLGPSSCLTRTVDRIFPTPTPPLLHLTSHFSQPQQSHVPQGHPGSCQGWYYPTSTTNRQRQRILFQPLYGAQKGRVPQASPGPKRSQSLRDKVPFQDGINSVCFGLHGRRRVHVRHRHQRRLPPHTHSPSAPPVPSILCQRSTLAVCSAPLRAVISPTHIHQCDGGSIGGVTAPGNSRHTLFGRSSRQRPIEGRCTTSYNFGPSDPDRLGVDDQLQEVQPIPNADHGLPGTHTGFQSREGLPPTGQIQHPTTQGENPNEYSYSDPSDGYANPRDDGGILPSNSLCSVSHQTSATCHTASPTQGSARSRSTDSPSTTSEALPRLVAATSSHHHGTPLPSPPLAGSHNRCQSQGVGWCARTNHDPRSLGSGGDKAAHQSPRTEGDSLLSRAPDVPAPGPSSSDPVRQRYSSSVHQPPGWHQEPGGSPGNKRHLPVGRDLCASHIGGPHTRSRKLDGGLPEQGNSRSGRVEPSPGSLSTSRGQMGHARHRSDGITEQQKGSKLRGKKPRSTRTRGGRSGDSVAVLHGLHISSASASAKGCQEGQKREHSNDSGGTILAPEGLVCGPSGVGSRRSFPPSPTRGSAHSRSYSSPEFSSVGFNGVALEALVLRRAGAPSSALPTMLRARKPVSARIYHRVWKTFITWCEVRTLDPQRAKERDVLSFLQGGLSKGLAVSSLKVQISALSILLQVKLALRNNIKTFIQGATRLTPPYRYPVPPWDLNLVLSALQEDPYEPLDNIPLSTLTEKVVFLLAITSARRVSELAALSCRSPFTIIHADKVVLRPTPDFLPKVVSEFHLNQDLVVPSFCPNPKNPAECKLHNLDVVRAIKSYLEATKDVRKTDALFIIPQGPKCGTKAAKATLAKWIRATIIRAYAGKGKPPPLHVKAHSTRSLSTSWAIRHQASAEQVCRAATWASLHTFTRFYRLHTQASAEAVFGRKVLRTVLG